MRFEERLGQDLPAPREAAEDRAEPDGEPTRWAQGPQTAAERAAARRRLDRLADDW